MVVSPPRPQNVIDQAPTATGRRTWLGRARGIPLQGCLLLLVGCVALMFIISSIAGVWRSYRNEVASAESRMIQQVRAMVDSVDRELAVFEVSLRALSLSSSLRNLNVSAFEREARSLSSELGGSPISLFDSDGLELFETRRRSSELGSKPEVLQFDFGRLSTGLPEISNLAVDLFTGQPAVKILVPVFINQASRIAGEFGYILSISMKNTNFRSLLERQQSSGKWIAAIIDRRGAVVASSQYGVEPLPFPPGEALWAELGNSDVKIIRYKAPSQMAETHAVAFARSLESGYGLVLGVPVGSFAGPFWTLLIETQGAGMAAGLLGLAFAVVLAHRIAGGLHAIESLGSNVDRNAVTSTGIREVDDVARVLSKAQQERAEAESRRELVVSELNHRVKNTLATVQSVAAHTLKGSKGDLARFTSDFGARLQALATAHDLLTANAWRETGLSAIVDASLAPWIDKVRVDGDGAILLSPHQAQAMVLALHELATNAAKYGSLLRVAGEIRIRWYLRADQRAVFEWSEIGGPSIDSPPSRKGFGSRLLERALVVDLGEDAAVQLSFHLHGLRACIMFKPALA